MPIISPSQTCQTCSAMSLHVASLILLKKLDSIAEYDHHIVFIFLYKKVHLMVEYDHQVLFPSTVFIIDVAFPFNVFTLSYKFYLHRFLALMAFLC